MHVYIYNPSSRLFKIKTVAIEKAEFLIFQLKGEASARITESHSVKLRAKNKVLSAIAVEHCLLWQFLRIKLKYFQVCAKLYNAECCIGIQYSLFDEIVTRLQTLRSAEHILLGTWTIGEYMVHGFHNITC